MDGLVTVHRKYRKITVSGRGTSRTKKQGIAILKELKKSNKTFIKIQNMEDKLRCATSISKGKSSHVPNGVRVINLYSNNPCILLTHAYQLYLQKKTEKKW